MSFYHWFSSHPNEISLSGDSSRMSTIGKELRIAGANKENATKQSDFRRISSVPDIWSQHRLFEMLLLNKVEDASYQEYVDIANREWRAMLALLVMAESYGVKIETEPIRFPGKDDPRKKYSGSGYLFAAYSTRPHRAQWPSMDIYYVKDGDSRYPIAMSSPTVHVIPTKDAWDNLRAVYGGRIPWVTDNQVFAPVVDEDGIAKPFLLGERQEDQLPAMMPVHALMLQRWLARYRAEIAQRQRNNDPAASLQSVKLLSDYEDALAQAFRLNAQSMPSLENFFATGDHQEGLKLDNYRVPQNLKIFLDRALYSVIDQNSTQAEILDTHRFAGGIAPECLLSKSNNNGEYTQFFIPMPVTQTFWQLWKDNEDLNPTYSIRCAFMPDGVTINRITAYVIIGGITFSKTYSIGNIDSESWRNLCTAGIWPRQKIAGWSEYYLFCNEIGGYKLEPDVEIEKDNKRCHPKNDQTGGELNYFRLDKAPNKVVMKKGNDVIGYLKIRERKEIALGQNSRVFHAAIDFGTSATTLYGAVNDNTASCLSSVNLWSLPLINMIGGDDKRSSLLEKYFFPTLPPKKNGSAGIASRPAPVSIDYERLQGSVSEIKEFPSCIPMQTILADVKTDGFTREALLDSWIYFRSLLQLRNGKEWPEMHSNLKWAHAKTSEQSRIQAILSEILMMLALEARSQNCGYIKITASYPLSFDMDMCKTYFSALNLMLRNILKKTGLSIQSQETLNTPEGGDIKGDGLVDRITESEAVFRFSVRQDATNDNYFVVDFGGGSTDIFISLINVGYSRDYSSTSLKFGARKILIEKLLHNDAVLLKQLMNKFADKFQELNIFDPTKYIQGFADRNKSSMVEDLFSIRIRQNPNDVAADLQPSTFGEAFMRACAEEREERLVLELKKRIAFYLGAAIWLSGVMLRNSNTVGVLISLLFTGNGSKMIHWLTPETDRIRHYIYLLINDSGKMFMPRENFSIRFSTMPKEEVAFGSLLDLPNGFFDPDQQAPKQVAFDQIHSSRDDLDAYSAVRYEHSNIKTERDDFAEYITAYRKACVNSFEWSFEENEYDPSILDSVGFRSSIKTTKEKDGYFLSALEEISARYMPTDTSHESN